MHKKTKSHRGSAVILFLLIFALLAFVLWKNSEKYLLTDDYSFNSPLSLRASNKNQRPIFPISPETSKQIISKTANIAIRSLKFKNFHLLSKYIHPQYGVKFSPYPYILSDDIVFKRHSLKKAYASKREYVWGFKNASEEIEYNFSDYYDRYVYNQDFSNAPIITYNKPIIDKNIIDNIRTFYPDAIIVEYYIPGVNPKLEGKDWTSLRLAFEKYQSNWYLVGIIHARAMNRIY
jgi:hypothetical protein